MNDIKTITSNREIIQQTAEKLIDMVDNGEIEAMECPVTHRFAPGMYLREILMPAGTVIIGKIHSTEHFNVVLTGRCTVITADERKEITAPHTFISKAGVQKTVIVHEDCQWQTLHVTDKTEIEDIEKEVICESYDDLAYDGMLENLKRIEQ